MTLALHGKSRRRKSWLLFAALIAIVFGVSGSLMLNRDETKAAGPSITTVVHATDLNGPCATPTQCYTNGPTGWHFYNDENDTGDPSLGNFVAGPATAPLGTGGVQITVSGTQRRNLATYQFAGTPLNTIDQLKFSTYNASATNGGGAGPTNRSGYLQFNISFDGNDTWQNRISFIPRDNGTVLQNQWQEWDALNSGNALWRYSGGTWPAPNPTSGTKSWSQILADYSSAKIRVTDGFFGIRVGEPYADGYTENIDKIVFGTTTSTQTFDFEPPTPVTTVVQAANLTAPAGGGWLFYDDNTDTYNNTPGVLGSFVTGPGAPPLGSGSAQIALPSGGRTNLATYQFTGTPLKSITQLGFSASTTVAANPPYIVMNVDFNLSDSFQNRLVYVPTGVTANTWQAFDAIQGGAALWTYSGTNWPVTGGSGSTPKTWNQILADYPNARIRVTDAHVGIRNGHPGPVETNNLDRFVFGTSLAVKVFDFEPTIPCTTTCYVNAATGNDLYDGATPSTPKKTIQAAMVAVSPSGIVHVAAGTYNEDVTVLKDNIKLLGAGVDQSIIVGQKGGSANTLTLTSVSNVLVDGFTITRDGNNTLDWFDANGALNNQGVAFGSGGGSNTLQNSKITGNRNGVYIEGTTNTVIKNNIIDFNRTGIHMVDDVSGTVIENNFITNNWTMGVLFRGGEGAVNAPPAHTNLTTAVTIHNNDISGNWYSQIEARSKFNTVTLDVENNWLGTVAPTAANQQTSGEPGYSSAPIPVEYGGTALPLVAPKAIIWNGYTGFNASNPLDYTPWLCSGVDTSPAIGFQPQTGCGDMVVTNNTANVGGSVSVQVIANNVVNLYGVQAFLQYDSSKLLLTNVVLGNGLLPEYVVPMSQPANQVNFSFSQQFPTAPVTGTNVLLATLTFTATAPGAALVEFRTTPTTILSDNNGFSIGPATKTNGTITITSAPPSGDVSGKILLQGRSNHSGATAEINPPPHTPPAPAIPGNPLATTTTTGDFTINTVPVGSQVIRARMLGYLLASKTVGVLTNANAAAGTVVLLGGDANMSGAITIADLSLIAGYFGQIGTFTPTPAPNTTPDINGDGVVSILDLSLTAGNYGQLGPKVW